MGGNTGLKIFDICVDFDGTIVTHEYPDIGNPVPECLRVLRELRRHNNRLILFTMRSGKSLREAVDYLSSSGVKLQGINENPDQYKWTSSPKAFGHIYIDDAAIGIPLKEDSSLSDRPFVDWVEVRGILIQKNVIPG